MGYKSATQVYETVDLSSGDTVTIQIYRGTAADLIEAALYRGEIARRRTTTGSDGVGQAVTEQGLDSSAYLYETCIQGIHSWTCAGDPEPEDTVWPVDRKHIGELSAPDRHRIFTRIQALNAPPDEKKGKDGSATSS